MKLSIIIPAYNEEDRIIVTLRETVSYLSGKNYDSEIIVVSDGSVDHTRETVEEMALFSKIPLKILEYHPNRGKGYAVRFGMLEGRGQIIMFMDADYAVPVSEVEKGIRLIEEGCDAAIGSRALEGSRVITRQNLFREISARIYTIVQNRYLGIFYRDTQCGFKLFTRHAAYTLFSIQRLESVIFDPEILWLAKKAGFHVAEFPVEWRHISNSRIRYDSIKKSIFVFQELFRIKRLHSTSLTG
ncbi:MAG: dolichyl-phosphate beta-glucosyltransferase [Thermodesulfobacteriota bacterium]